MPEIRYVKITLLDGARFILRVTRETPFIITGFEVNAEGDEIAPPGHDRRLRIVGRDSIKRTVEMRMSRKYATLEPATKSAAQLDADIAEALHRPAKRSRIRKISSNRQPSRTPQGTVVTTPRGSGSPTP